MTVGHKAAKHAVGGETLHKAVLSNIIYTSTMK